MQIGGEGRGQTVLAWLATRYPHSDRDTWRRRAEEGEVTLDERPAAADEPLRPGQWLCWRRPGWVEPEVPRNWRVLYEDAAVVAVEKPRGLPTTPAGGFLENTLQALVQADFPGATPMHRLGRGTSGVVLFGRTAAARSVVQAAFREGRVEKVYRALVTGEPPEVLEIDLPIGRVEHPRLGTIFGLAPGKPSQSRAVVVGRRPEGVLVDVTIATGRPHQIRIHMAALGFPLWGDPLYGLGAVVAADALPGDLGYRLHARYLALAHPTDGRRLVVESPVPEDLEAIEGS